MYCFISLLKENLNFPTSNQSVIGYTSPIELHITRVSLDHQILFAYYILNQLELNER